MERASSVRSSQKKGFKKDFFEQQAWTQQKVVVGIDEVGRGCLAGPVMAAAVIVPPETDHPLLLDSKEMTLKQRLIAYEWITKYCRVGIGVAHNRLIDSINIWHATLVAMKRAVLALDCKAPLPACFLVDAMPLKLTNTIYQDIPVHHFPFGESRSSSIAAASIVAKVTRDRLMTQLQNSFPVYGFACHKGYGTAKHKEALALCGPSVIHRISFLRYTRDTSKNQKDDYA